MPKMFSPCKMFLKKIFDHEDTKKPASKVAEPAKIQPKSQFLFHKNLPPRDFSLMTLAVVFNDFLNRFHALLMWALYFRNTMGWYPF